MNPALVQMPFKRRESRERLSKVMDNMKDNPGIMFEIGTHTDIRGNAEYNRDLSQKCADATKEFTVKNGMADNRVIAKGYGESQPLVKCETEESCTEEDHGGNSRIEHKPTRISRARRPGSARRTAHILRLRSTHRLAG